jgi:hypothetical protein
LEVESKGWDPDLLAALKDMAKAEGVDALAAAVRKVQGVVPNGTGGLQRRLTTLAARRAADALVADLKALPESTRRDQDLVRVESMRRQRSFCLAFLQDHLLGDAALEGLSLQLALRRCLGLERALPHCVLCAARPGGTLHARFCRSSGIRAYDLFVHDRVKNKLADLISSYCGTTVLKESRLPFVAYAAANSSSAALKRIDLLVPDAGFAEDVFGPASALMIDVTNHEPQCPSHLRRALVNPAAGCFAAEALKDSCYSGFYDPDCYNRATFATGSFGCMNKQAEQVVSCIASAWADKHSSEYGPSPDGLKSVAVCRVRAALSAALHAGLSQRVTAYMAEASGGSRGGERESTHAALVRDPPWEVAAP